MSPSLTPWILALVFTPLGTVVAAASYAKVRRVRRLLRDGATAEGVVVRLEASRMQDADSDATVTLRSSGTTVYAPVIAWTTGDGRRMETTSALARPRDKVPAPGRRVQVRYDPADPTRWTPAGDGPALWQLFTAVGALFTATGLGFLAGALLP
ncbi:DUF3592 domain-containing protein [Streptomyces sp. WAC06614]|uniref:DUF3592 domain-containing protein n=1 Tax=Streptomyces sp. WAC06614 TaxID=2487416 RepID=UPI000F796780|nr:DUF3592 domain-containing protein [Streptomyces sp. WAC06614]RSS68891.1 DUF3592 domain-containing protein [Streptomyces sp. WAC06614]